MNDHIHLLLKKS